MARIVIPSCLRRRGASVDMTSERNKEIESHAKN
jgi:hypothetical protein